MATIKLFHQDPLRTEFTAQVLSCEPQGAHFAVILDQTCFYATSGGQPHDTGVLGGQRVVDVQEDDAGVITHLVDGPLAGQVRGEIDWARRWDQTQQHTGQHLLSGAFEQLFDANTMSWHLGAESCTVDLDIEMLTPEQIEQAEWEMNRVIQRALPVVTHLTDAEGVKAFPLRKPPTVESDIRVVEIQGYDWSACAGTHVQHLGQLGLLKIKSWEKNKKFTRVEFLCGDRALRDYIVLDRTTRDLARSLSVGQLDLAGVVGRNQEEVSGLRKRVKVLQEQLLEIEAAELVKEARKVAGLRVVRQVFAGRPQDEVKLLAGKVASHPGTVAVFGTRGAIPQLIMHRSVDLRLDVGAVMKQILPLIDGKGGGSPLQAQGGGSRQDGVEAALDKAIELLKERALA